MAAWRAEGGSRSLMGGRVDRRAGGDSSSDKGNEWMHAVL